MKYLKKPQTKEKVVKGYAALNKFTSAICWPGFKRSAIVSHIRRGWKSRSIYKVVPVTITFKIPKS